MKALLLDVDRTLVDLQSFTDYAAANRDVAAALGDVELDVVPETDWGSETQRAMATLVSLADHPELWQRASDLIEAHEIAAIDEAFAMPGLDEFLQVTAAVPRALVTLMGQRAVEEVASRFGIDVPVVIGRRAGIPPKPAPDQLVTACRALEVEGADAAFVGDSSWDEVAAARAGIRFIGVTNGGAPSQFTAGSETVLDLSGVSVALGLGR